MPSRSLLLLFLALYSASLMAQSIGGPARVYGPADTEVPTPAHSTKTVSDVGAIQVVIDFVAMTKVTGWTGMTGTGAITMAGASGETDPAQIAALGSTATRLDVQRAGGKESTIFNGSLGTFVSAAGKRSSVSSDVAALGLLAFPRLFASGYPAGTTVLSDRGSVTVNGKALHRITLDDPSTDKTGSPWKTVDLYFDPATKQLVESVAFVHLSTADAALYTLETTYEDYQTAGGATVPFRYTQSLNGNLQWTLQLTGVSFSAPASSLFSF